MGSFRASYAIVVVALTAIGCGGDDSNSGTTDISCNNPSLKYCANGSGAASECTQNGGQVVDRCPTAGVVLECTVTEGAEEARVYFYDQSTVDALKVINPDPCLAFNQQ